MDDDQLSPFERGILLAAEERMRVSALDQQERERQRRAEEYLREHGEHDPYVPVFEPSLKMKPRRWEIK